MTAISFVVHELNMNFTPTTHLWEYAIIHKDLYQHKLDTKYVMTTHP